MNFRKLILAGSALALTVASATAAAINGSIVWTEE